MHDGIPFCLVYCSAVSGILDVVHEILKVNSCIENFLNFLKY